MSDITLSLGGKWLHASAEREKQGQMIAHLTNQLEGLRAAYTEDLEKVAKNKELLVKLQEDLDRVEAERDEWKAAYNGVVNKRIERDHLVEDMLSQLKTLEVTTRNEELRSNDATKKSTLLQKEKELVLENLEKTRKELDEVYTKLAAANDELATHREATGTLTAALQAMTRSRDTKENQVVSLLKEKNRLFRLVTDLRSTIKVAGGSVSKEQGPHSKVGAHTIGDVEDQVKADVADVNSFSKRASSSSSSSKKGSKVNGVNNLINSTLNGTIDRPKWASSTPSLKVKTSNKKKDITSAGELDEMSFAGSVSNLFFASKSSRGTSKTSSPNKRSRRFDDDEEEEKRHSDDGEDEESQEVEDKRTIAARKNLVLRLKRQIELLEEKNTELDKTIGLVRSENQQLLVRFRGAHDRRTQAEQRLKKAERELEEIKKGGGHGGSEHSGHQDEYPVDGAIQPVHFTHGFYEPVPPPGKQRPNTPGSTRWR